MNRFEKLIKRILNSQSDVNINFAELCQLLDHLRFDERIKGDHHIFSKIGVEEIINIQPIGSKAKAYQVKQVRTLILKYRLGENHANPL